MLYHKLTLSFKIIGVIKLLKTQCKSQNSVQIPACLDNLYARALLRERTSSVHSPLRLNISAPKQNFKNPVWIKNIDNIGITLYNPLITFNLA